MSGFLLPAKNKISLVPLINGLFTLLITTEVTTLAITENDERPAIYPLTDLTPVPEALVVPKL